MEDDNSFGTTTVTIYYDICESCGGIGHSSDCECVGFEDFVYGCCSECNGAGFIVNKQKDDGIILP